MFLQEEIKPDLRPFLAVFAPEHEFLFKYFDRRFDCRITSDPAEVDTHRTAFVLRAVDVPAGENERRFRDECNRLGLSVITLLLPDVIGTGMTGLPMRMARGVSRGTLMKIKDNEAVRSLVHATDVANAAAALQGKNLTDCELAVAAPPSPVNGLIEALAHRIKDKRVATLSRKWARWLYGKEYFTTLTIDRVIDTDDFKKSVPDFKFIDPLEYLTTHVYDNESL